jgi:hypothetical protein
MKGQNPSNYVRERNGVNFVREKRVRRKTECWIMGRKKEHRKIQLAKGEHISYKTRDKI